jgi:hypothetical protein
MLIRSRRPQRAQGRTQKDWPLAHSPSSTGLVRVRGVRGERRDMAMAGILRKMKSCHTSTLRVMWICTRRVAGLPEWRFFSIQAKEYFLLLSAISADSNDCKEWARESL